MPTLNLRRKIIRLESVHAWAVPGAGLGQLRPSRHPAMAGEVIKPIQQGCREPRKRSGALVHLRQRTRIKERWKRSRKREEGGAWVRMGREND